MATGPRVAATISLKLNERQKPASRVGKPVFYCRLQFHSFDVLYRKFPDHLGPGFLLKEAKKKGFYNGL